MQAREPAELVQLLRDNTADGAAVLARQAIGVLRDYVAFSEGDNLRARTEVCVLNLIDARPDMAAVGNLVRCWKDSFGWPHADFRAGALDHCDAVLRSANRALEETVRNASRRLAKLPANGMVLTHSASSTVRAAVAGLHIRLLVTASEPGGEGRRFAADLGLPCIDDDDGPAAAAEALAVLVGADAIGTAAFVNKVGTRVLGEAAERAGTPFFVVAESYKWLPASQSLVARGAFETVPNAYVTAFLTDDVPGVSFRA